MFNSVLAANLLDEADGLRDSTRRVVFQPKGQGKKEKYLGVARSFDAQVELRIDREHEFPFHVLEASDLAIVHPQPLAVSKRMTVRLLDGGTRRRTDVREHQPGPDVFGDLAQISIIPDRVNTLEKGGNAAVVVPADSESIAVRGVRPKTRVKTLIKQRMLRLVQQVTDVEGGSGIGEPAAHGLSPIVQRRRSSNLMRERTRKISRETRSFSGRTSRSTSP